jgi:phenylpropionate dioxygenase-like ring-hydroxylating dioxygenase large terminal subunit
MGFKKYWYILCESRELKPGKVLSREILGEWIALFRGKTGSVVAIRNRCIHRSGRLSSGRLENGNLVCNYHGWTYDETGHVIRIPADSPEFITSKRCAKTFQTCEADNFIYVCLDQPGTEKPFPMPCFGKKGYSTIRLQHTFDNNVTNCAENFVDIPHTTFVHPGIFRYDRRQKLTAKIERRKGLVRAEYGKETNNFGIFSRFLNPRGKEIKHVDEFYAPNITCVQYLFGEKWHFIITSQSVPISDKKTIVYTDLTYNYGVWNFFARPIVYWQAKAIIRQDVDILGEQMKVIEKYGTDFQNARADILHVYIESIRDEIEKGGDPNLLPEKTTNVEFWI